jgi:hypothetical protein
MALILAALSPAFGHAHEFKEIVNESKSWSELLAHFTFLNPLEKSQLAAIFKETPIPKVTVADGGSFELGDIKARLISPASGDFVVNGHTVKIQKGLSFKEVCETLAEASNKPPKVSWLQFSLLPEAAASSLSGIDKDLITDSYILARDPFRALDYEDSWMTWLLPSAAQGANAVSRKAARVLTKGSGLFLLGAWGGYYLDRAVMQLHPLKASCEGQVKDLKALLKNLKLSISKLDCDDWRGTARGIDFWTPTAESNMGKRYFKYDLHAGVLQETVHSLKQVSKKTKLTKSLNPEDNPSLFNEKKIGYYFSTFKWRGDPLTAVRTVEGTNNKKIVDISAKSNKTEFDIRKTDIEPYRQVLHYMGTNAFCEKCQDHKEAGPDRLVDEEPASYLNEQVPAETASETTD